MKLIKIRPSKSKGKKYSAFFMDKGKEKVVHFGATGYSDFTKGASEDQRKNYRSRHSTGSYAKPDTANALSYHILWGESKSILKNIEQFKKKYNL